MAVAELLKGRITVTYAVTITTLDTAMHTNVNINTSEGR